MYYKDHPPPHFHAYYAGHEVVVRIEDGVVEGRFPSRALGLVLEWLALHRQELLADWILAEEKKPLVPIAPLE